VLVADGDEAALEALYRRYGGACFALARRILDDNQLAEDVVQQVFTALWKGSGFDSSRGAVSTWLMSVTHHKSIDVLRREAPRRKRLASEQALLEVAVSGPGTDEQAWMRLRAERTRDALKTLPAEQRELLLLADYDGYTQSEIAGLTGVPLGTVRTLAAMRKLPRNGRATPVTIFRAAAGSATGTLRVAYSDTAAFAVSVEPAAGEHPPPRRRTRWHRAAPPDQTLIVTTADDQTPLPWNLLGPVAMHDVATGQAMPEKITTCLILTEALT
jgi:RNA polymerase sigma-70 factor (ECF subfamily)